MSRIEHISVCQPIAENSPDDWRTSIGQILVAVQTDDGLTGYGVGGGGLAGMHVVDTVLRPLLSGCDAEPVEELWERMARAVLPFGPEGIAMLAVSGVDLALWDRRGKAAGQPVARLLSSQVDLNRPIETYQTVWGMISPDVSRHPSGVKLHLGRSSRAKPTSTQSEVDLLIAQVEQAREAIGPRRPLMVDAWMTWDVETTLRFANRAFEFGLDWIEEPLPLNNTAGYQQLARDCPIPIAGGEHIYTAEGFRRLVDWGLHSILQPDVCWCGGMTELVKICELARDADVRVVPHRGGESWGLHGVASLCDPPLAESGREWMSWVGGQPDIVDGVIRLPDRPGFGVEIDPDIWQRDSTRRLMPR